MPIKHVNFAAQQRVEAADMNAIGDLELTNLALAMSAYFGPGALKISRGGRVHQTAPASKNVEIEPLAGFGQLGLPIILESLDTKAIADNSSGNPRIDLVSVTVTLANSDLEEATKFWNPSTEASFDAPHNRRTTLTVTTHVTQGTAASSPSEPATPAGHIPLAHVDVANGMTEITDDDITMVSASYVSPVREFTWEWGGEYGEGNPVDLPYQTPNDLLVLNVPEGRTAVILATVHFDIAGASSRMRGRVSLESYDGSISTELGSTIVETHITTQAMTANVMGYLVGGGGELGIRMRFAAFAGSGITTPNISLLGFSAPFVNRIVALLP